MASAKILRASERAAGGRDKASQAKRATNWHIGCVDCGQDSSFRSAWRLLLFFCMSIVCVYRTCTYAHTIKGAYMIFLHVFQYLQRINHGTMSHN